MPICTHQTNPNTNHNGQSSKERKKQLNYLTSNHRATQRTRIKSNTMGPLKNRSHIHACLPNWRIVHFTIYPQIKIGDTHEHKHKPTSNIARVTKDNKKVWKILNSPSKPTQFTCSLFPVKRIYSKHNQDEQQMIPMMTYTKLRTFSLWFIFHLQIKI